MILCLILIIFIYSYLFDASNGSQVCVKLCTQYLEILRQEI